MKTTRERGRNKKTRKIRESERSIFFPDTQYFYSKEGCLKAKLQKIIMGYQLPTTKHKLSI